MTQRDASQPGHPEYRPADAVLRAAADGETEFAPPGALDAARAADPSSDHRIAFERALGEAVARSMSGIDAPASLRERVVRAIRAEAPASAVDRLRLINPDDHPRVYRNGPALRHRVWLAVAAALVFVTGLVLTNPGGVIQWGPPVMTSSGVPLRRVMRTIDFTLEQHGGCSDFEKVFKRKMTALSEPDAIRTAIELLSRVPAALELRSKDLEAAGYRFAGLGRCAVPGKGRSVHMIYRPDPSIAPGAPVVSLFAQEDKGDLLLAEGVSFTNASGDGSGRSASEDCVTVWRKDGLIYYLVAPPLPEAVRRAFDAPSGEQSLL